jgi:hypothetical protein
VRFGLGTLVAVVVLAFAATASAAEVDVRGTWNCCSGSTNPLVGTQTWVITSEDLNTGQWSGWGYGGAYSWPQSGTISGTTMTWTIPFYYELPSYSASGTGTINAKTWNTNFTDSNGSTGTFVLAKLAKPPAPVAGKSMNAQVVGGKVRVKFPKTKSYVDLSKAAVQLPVGTIVDATNGTIALTAAQSTSRGKTATANFFKGIFQIRQKATARPVTDLKILGGTFAACGTAASAGSASAAKKHKVRTLWGKGKGLFRTTGKYASATIRGTAWAVTDYCDGTLTKVTQGSVLVRDFVRKRNVVVKAGRSYFARAKK